MPYSVEFPDGNRYSGQITSGFYYFIDLLNITVKAAWLLGNYLQRNQRNPAPLYA